LEAVCLPRRAVLYGTDKLVCRSEQAELFLRAILHGDAAQLIGSLALVGIGESSQFDECS
jgi:hypothetical protein